MRFCLQAVACSFLFWCTATASFAIPYASQVKALDTMIAPGEGTRISYFLNEPADTVTVSLTHNETTVATFSGPSAQGLNTVDWNGTSDNATGAIVNDGQLHIVVTATGSQTAWTEIAGNGSITLLPPLGTLHRQLFAGCSPNDCLFIMDQDSDFFGQGISAISNNIPGVAAALNLKSDLSTLDGSDGYASRIFRAVDLEDSAINTTLWGMSNDPDSEKIIYFTGQSGESTMRFLRGDLDNPATLVSADPGDFLSGLPPRAVKVVREGNAKFAYICAGLNLYKAPMDPVSNVLTGAPVRVTQFAVPNRYARGIDIDAEGNLYFVNKDLNFGKSGTLFRWDASDAAGPTPILREETATWHISTPDSMLNMMGPAITPAGDVYVAMVSGDKPDKQSGIFTVGNTSSDTLIKTLSPDDCVVDFSAIGTPQSVWNANTVTFNVRSDPAGNVVAIERDSQQIRLFSPPGSFTTPVTAPLSQTIRIGAGVDNWSSY